MTLTLSLVFFGDCFHFFIPGICSKKEEPAAEEPAAEVEAATAAEALQKGLENAATDVKEGGSTAVEALTSGGSGRRSPPPVRRRPAGR